MTTLFSECLLCLGEIKLQQFRRLTQNIESTSNINNENRPPNEQLEEWIEQRRVVAEEVEHYFKEAVIACSVREMARVGFTPI